MRVEYCKETYEDYEDEDYEDLSEMANVTTVDSGLPFPVWIIYNGALKFTEPDRPHVKVEIDDCRIPCLIDSRCPGFTDNSHAEIIEKLKQLVSDMALLDNSEDLYTCVIVGGSALVLMDKIYRSTHDIDSIASSEKILPLLDAYGINMNVKAYLTNILKIIRIV